MFALLELGILILQRWILSNLTWFELISLTESYWKEIRSKIRKGIPTYIHVDLDVIDPNEYKNVKCPVLHGLSIADLEQSIEYILRETTVVGMSIVENIETDTNNIKKLHGIFERVIKF